MDHLQILYPLGRARRQHRVWHLRNRRRHRLLRGVWSYPEHAVRMPTMLHTWAKTWGISDAALSDLYARMLAPIEFDRPFEGYVGEALVQASVRREGKEKGVLLMRNNVGVLMDRDNRPVRYGLANDSKVVNEHMKSADLIGIRSLMITPQLVGSVVGQFVSRECKKPGYRYNPNDKREAAQMRWATLINSYGGDAAIVDTVGTL